MDARWEDEVLVERPTSARAKVVPRPAASGEAGLDCVVLLATARGPRAISFPVREGPPGPWPAGSPKPSWWGMRRAGPGRWSVSPSVVAGDVHEVLVLEAVPEPPPWRAAA